MQELKIIDERKVLGKEFRVYGDFENPLFLAKDVAEWIEYDKSSVNKMLENVDENEKVRNIVPTHGGNQESWLLTEDGLYEVLMQSRKPIAKEFKKEVKVVLKSIRKNGGYIAGQESLSPEMIVANALIVAQNIIKQRDEKIAELTPKGEYFDALVDRNLLTNFRDTAKELKMGQNEFIQRLLDGKFVFRDSKGRLKPYSNHLKDGLFEVKEYHREGFGNVGLQTLITPRGRETFRLLMTA